MGTLFSEVGLAERRALRTMLAERRHVEERELLGDESLVGVLRSLPIFETHAASTDVADASDGDGSSHAEASDGSGCVCLRVEEHRLAPSGVSTGLLDARFVRCVVSGEDGLVAFAGVPQLVRSRFYREHVFPRLGELGAGELRANHKLSEQEDEKMRS